MAQHRQDSLALAGETSPDRGCRLPPRNRKGDTSVAQSGIAATGVSPFRFMAGARGWSHDVHLDIGDFVEWRANGVSNCLQRRVMFRTAVIPEGELNFILPISGGIVHSVVGQTAETV